MLLLATDDVHLWYTRPEWSSDDQLRRVGPLLSLEEREANARFKFSEKRRDHLVGRAMIRTTLSRYADVGAQEWSFSAGPFGRPEIAGPLRATGLRFSLSHTSGLIAVAVALNVDVGIDVEHLDRRLAVSEISRYLAASEAADVESCPADQRLRRLLEYWTLKEAYIKATGLGFSIPLGSFAVTLSTPPAIAFADDSRDDASDWLFCQPCLSDTHVSAVAVRRPGLASRFGALRTSCFDWRATDECASFAS